jgi:hypothetical protein
MGIFKHVPEINIIFLMDDKPGFTCQIPENDVKEFITVMPQLGERVKVTYGGNPFENIYGYVIDIFKIYNFEIKHWDIFIKLSVENCK